MKCNTAEIALSSKPGLTALVMRRLLMFHSKAVGYN